MRMQKILSLTLVFAILAWAIGLNAARADCQPPLNPGPGGQATAWYYNCVQDQAIQQQYEIQQQNERLQALENQARQQLYAR
jgi:hypothetical protein